MKGPYRAALSAGIGAGPASGPLLLRPARQPRLVRRADGLPAACSRSGVRSAAGAPSRPAATSPSSCRSGGGWSASTPSSGTYIDGPQVRVLPRAPVRAARPGDGVIVCAPTPTWVHTGEGDPDAFNSLHFFEHDVVRRPHRRRPGRSTGRDGAAVDHRRPPPLRPLRRGRSPGPAAGAARQLVTCGLGGAYLLETHRLPDPARTAPPRLPDGPAATRPRALRLRARWPDVRAVAAATRAGLLGGPPRGLAVPQPGPVAAAAASYRRWRTAPGLRILGRAAGRNPVAAAHASPRRRRSTSPGRPRSGSWSRLLVARPLPVLRGRAAAPRRRRRCSRSARSSSSRSRHCRGGRAAAGRTAGRTGWCSGVALLAPCSSPGSSRAYALALSILAGAQPTVAQGWQLSAQAIEDYKGFLRIRVDADGRLTLYPVVVDTVCQDWDVEAVVAPRPRPPAPTRGRSRDGTAPVELRAAPVVVGR